ncbi:hypothetical protein ACFFUO_11915 [Vibrio artabrorum]|uniref:hypothetical protein n=1 Tax=Vibrio artabrorum TaxID=446374 RepID=UPI0021C2EF8E|nr:hypothetical protein [Vibrio artabrorum]
MKFLIAISIAVLLNACATTPQKLRNSAPVFESTSMREASVLAGCITEKWENVDYFLYSPIVNSRTLPSGYEVTQYLDGVLVHLADIEQISKGSQVTVYTESLNLGENSAVKAVEICEQ